MSKWMRLRRKAPPEQVPWSDLDPSGVIPEVRRASYEEYMRNHPADEVWEEMKVRYPFLGGQITLEQELLVIEDMIAQGEEIGVDDHYSDYPEAKMLLDGLRRSRDAIRRVIAGDPPDSSGRDRGTPPV